MYDPSVEKLQHEPIPIRSSLGQTGAGADDITPLFETIRDSKKSFAFEVDNNYDMLDPETDADERMKAEGWAITHSEN